MKDIDMFRQFLESPVFNARPDHKLIAFFEHCYALKIWDSDMKKTEFLAATGLDLNDGTFDKRVSSLNDQLSLFAGALQFSINELDHWPYTLSYCKTQQLEHAEVETKQKEGIRKINKMEQDAQYFQLMLEMELELANYSSSRVLSPQDRGFTLLNEYLDNYYIIQKLRFLCASANEQQILATGPGSEVRSNAVLLQWMRLKHPGMPTLAKVYFHAYHILQGLEDEKNYRLLRQELKTWQAENSEAYRPEFTELYGYMINYFLMKSNTGAEGVMEELDLIYDESLDKGYLLNQGKLSPEHFGNILNIKCRLGNAEEARVLFEKFGDRLTDAQEGAAAAYNEIILLYYEEQYPELIEKAEALVEAKGAIKADQYYGIGLRQVLLKTYYEYLGSLDGQDYKSWDEVDAKLKLLLRAFPAYINRKKVASIMKVYYTNFRNAIQQLYDLRSKAERREKAEELLNDFSSSSNLPNKDWFMAKARELL